MTQEEKQLLLKDLCARLPYHLGIRIYNDGWEGCKRGEFDNIMGFHHVEAFLCDRIDIMPYLRPMSSMMEEEKEEFENLVFKYDFGDTQFSIENTIMYWDSFEEVLDYLISHHFDFRNLIEKGLALEAPEGMYKTE